MSTYQVSDKSVKHSLNLTNFAITFGMVFYSIFGQPVGSSLFTGFMRKLGTNDLVYSVVMALPVLGGVSQILGSYFLERTGKRRFLFLASGFVHRLFWIPVALIPLFIVSDMHQAIIISITILITVSSVAYSVNTVVFNSWMGDLVPQEIAGRFFSTRSLISNISGGIAALLVGAFIDRVNNLNGFAIIFILGVLFGMVEIITFFRVKNPPMTLSESKPSLVHIIIEPFKNKNYMKFVAFATIFMFGVNFAVPFFNVYMIEKLKMSYFIIAMANSVTYSIGAVVFVRKWGALADRFGNKPVVFCCALGVAIVPIIWLFAAPGHILMTYVANFVAGVAWSGYYVAIFNQSVWLAPEKNRSAYIACYTLCTSAIGTALANVCGGYFMQYITGWVSSLHVPFIMNTSLNSYHLLFILSTVMRLLALIIFLPPVLEQGAYSAGKMVSSLAADFRKNMKHS